MERVRFGIVGCGVIGKVHIGVAKESPLIDLVAITDLREQAAKEAAEKFGVPTVHPSAEAMFADPRIEAVILALPTAGRAQLAMQAFAKGKHVLVEKPVGMNAAEVEQMIRARGKLSAACCSSRMRFQPAARFITEFLAAGKLGELRLIRYRGVNADGGPPKNPPPPWRLKKAMNGGGIFVNWGCYDLDYLLGIAGWTLRPKTVMAQAWTIAPDLVSHIAPGSDAETHVAALIRCEGGTVISAERGEYMTAETEEAFQIIGTKGSLRMKMTPGAGKKVWLDEASADRAVATKVAWEGDEEWKLLHSGPSTDFAQAIREGREPSTSLERAMVVQKITDAIYASAEKGTAVEIR